MATNSTKVAVDLSPYFRIFADGRIDRLRQQQFVPPSDDPTSAVRSKDVVIDPETGVSVRLFAPRLRDPPSPKLPLVVHIHGGAFCIGSVASPTFHNFISTLVEKGNVVVVSVEYRLAPENPMPAAYEDSWAAFRWVAAHAGGGPDPWLNDLADFRRVFIGGESAGANIANDVALRAGIEKLPGVEEVSGIFLVHPYFGREVEDKLYRILFPGSPPSADDDPRLNPVVDPRIGSMVGRRVLFMVADKDPLTARTKKYAERLRYSAWGGEVEMMESEEEGHCFYFFKPESDKAVRIMERFRFKVGQGFMSGT